MTEFIQARCPKCRRLLAECCEGSKMRIVCPRCKVMVSGLIVKGSFVATTVERKQRVTAVANPPMLTG